MSRPYILDDPAIEDRLLRKATLFLAAGLIIGFAIAFPFGFFIAHDLIRSEASFQTFLPFLAVLAGISLLQAALTKLTFGPEVKNLPRAAARVSLRTAYSDFGRRLPLPILVSGVVACLLLVPFGVLVLLFLPGPMTVPAVIMIALGVLCAAAYGYAIWLKLGER